MSLHGVAPISQRLGFAHGTRLVGYLGENHAPAWQQANCSLSEGPVRAIFKSILPHVRERLAILASQPSFTSRLAIVWAYPLTMVAANQC
jgi:hypothetical protein